MRISKAQIENLKNSILSIQPDSKVFLFGSRIDDNNKGGDIDILILGKRKLNLLEKWEIKKTFDFALEIMRKIKATQEEGLKIKDERGQKKTKD